MIKHLLDVAFGENSSNTADANLTVKIKGLSIDYSYKGPRGVLDKPADEKGILNIEDFEISGDLKTTMAGLFKMAMDIGDAIRSPKGTISNNHIGINDKENTQATKPE